MVDLSRWSTLEGQAVVALSALVVTSVCLLASLLLHRRHGWNSQTQYNLPPSPGTRIPVIGHLRLLRSALFKDRKDNRTLRERMGSIFTLWIGSVPMVFVSSADLAHEALVEKGAFFADRVMLPSRRIFTSNYRNINSAPYGNYWRTVRRNLVQEMVGSMKMQAFKPIREQIMQTMVQRFRAEAMVHDSVVSFYSNCRIAMFELLLFMCFGYSINEEDVTKISSFVEEFVPYQKGSLQDFFPFLKFFNRKLNKKYVSLRQKQVDIFNFFIQQHQKLSKLGQITPGSYLETLLRIQDDPGTKFSNGDIVSLCSEFLFAGTDTTVTTLEWTMAELVKNLPIQTKLYQHIHDAVGDRPVQENDLPKLPYLKAVITETLRLHPPGHSLLPHKVSKPCKLGGYDITPDMILQFDVISISRDPKIWVEPLEFRPERMLHTDVDITGTSKLTMIPFGAGRRICPGMGLAALHMELFVARLVQAFHFTPSQPGETVDLSERAVFTVVMKNPLKARIEERSKT